MNPEHAAEPGLIHDPRMHIQLSTLTDVFRQDLYELLTAAFLFNLQNEICKSQRCQSWRGAVMSHLICKMKREFGAADKRCSLVDGWGGGVTHEQEKTKQVTTSPLVDC